MMEIPRCPASAISAAGSAWSCHERMIEAVSGPMPSTRVRRSRGAERMAWGEPKESSRRRTRTGPIFGSMLRATMASRGDMGMGGGCWFSGISSKRQFGGRPRGGKTFLARGRGMRERMEHGFGKFAFAVG